MNQEPTKTWFGHPAGLSTLFFTELWERFSYYGMRALLVLFLVDNVQSGGMGLDDKTANAIYGLYAAFVYLACLPGGWIADRLLGGQRSIWIGGLIIAAGHFTLAIPHAEHELNLVSVKRTEELPTSGQQLVVVASVSNDLHIRIFGADGTRSVDKAASELTADVQRILEAERVAESELPAGTEPADKDDSIGEKKQKELQELVDLMPIAAGTSLTPAETKKIIFNATSVSGYSAQMPTFFLGLILVVIGTGFLKPNISAIVGQLYPEGGARRDAGFTIFYMGINMGAFLGPLICSYLGEKVNWHAGFGAAGVGMVAGVIQYRFSVIKLGDAGLRPSSAASGEGLDRAWFPVIGGFAIVAILVVLGLTGTIRINALALAQNTTYVIVGLAVLFFVYVFAFGKLDTRERKQTWVIVVLFMASAVFWSGFEQAGSSLNLFADRHTDRDVLGFKFPAGWFQSLNPFYIVVFGPIFAAMWVHLAKRQLDPSMPAKFAFGLLLLALGFLVMVGAAKLVTAGNQAAPYWLILTYLLHTMGELCVSPVGLSSVTKLAPKRFLGQMMGIWFLATSLGNLLAGLAAGRFNPESLNEMPGLFMQIVLVGVGAGLLLLVFSKPIKKLMGDIK